MKRFRIETLEKFETTATYIVEGDDDLTKETAIAQVRAGDVAYDSHDHPGNGDEFIAVLEVELETVSAALTWQRRKNRRCNVRATTDKKEV